MTTSKPLIVFAVAGALALHALAAPKEPSSRPVDKAVKERTGLAVRWQQDAAAREQALADVRALLKKPLTVNSAVQIALLNNRELLATFEDVGVSAADLREAGMWKNPSFDLSVRFPDRAPDRRKGTRNCFSISSKITDSRRYATQAGQIRR